jgi:hypothetical protein
MCEKEFPFDSKTIYLLVRSGSRHNAAATTRIDAERSYDSYYIKQDGLILGP